MVVTDPSHGEAGEASTEGEDRISQQQETIAKKDRYDCAILVHKFFWGERTNKSM